MWFDNLSIFFQLIDFLLRSPMRHAAIYDNGTYVYWLDVHIPPGSMYKPLKIDVAGPYYHKGLLDICNFNVIHVGSEIMGYVAANAKVTYVSTSGDSINDRATIELGHLSNVGREDADMFWMKNIVRLSVRKQCYLTCTCVNRLSTFHEVDYFVPVSLTALIPN
jgi:hypothetical protein